MKNVLESVREIEAFDAIGFKAGFIEKNRWSKQSELYDAVSRAFPDNKFEIISPRQTHSSDILFIDGNSSNPNPMADGTISRLPGICLTVRTADCVPMLFADPATGLFGAVHVGWRGFVGGIIEELFAIIRKNGSDFSNMRFFLGPSIGQCCFEIGDEVAALFDDKFVVNRDKRNFIDLPGAVRNKILSHGVNETDIRAGKDCTSCCKERFYSYRRDGEAPIQMVAYIFRAK